MTFASPTRAGPALLAVAVLLLAAACGGRDEPGDDVAPAPPPAETSAAPQPAPAPPPSPPPPEATVRVVDGDTGKPVRRARVVVAGEAVQAGGDGGARVLAARGEVKVRASAPGYRARTTRVRLAEGKSREIELWKPSLQWPMYGANPARTQVHQGIKLRPPFRVVWRRSTFGLIEFPAVVWEGVAYVNTMRGTLRAISIENGRVLWRKRVGSLMASSPTIDPERGVLVSTSMSPGDVKVIDLETGRTRWTFATGRAEPSPVIRKGIAYFGAANGNVYALDLDRRKPRWIYRGGVKITGSPALVGNRLFFGDYSGRVVALNARTGRVAWTGSAGSRVYGTVAVAGGRVFAPSVFSGLSALSARTGRLLWRVPVGAYLYSSPAVFRGRVYFGTYEGLVYSVAARSGRILWRRPAGGAVSGAVQVVAGVVYAASFGARTTAWHWRTGRELWGLPIGRYVPVSGNGGRLLMHGGGRIWAVEPKRKR